ncbi:MAG: filamentous hemagglutinin N-terminal domain-containing protein, partial [Enterobacteriaceae bacterium]
MLLQLSASCAVYAEPLPQALPTGGQVVAGQATLNQTPGQLNIQQSSASAVINWNSFDVGRQASVNFYQPNASSAVLNRITGGNPSQIFGQINANGQVYISNPDGVFFAPGASVHAGGFVATTMGINTQDFMAGSRTFQRNGSSAAVVNEGSLTAIDGGFVALLAPQVRNSGLIVANMGTVAMAAGERIELQFNSNDQLVNLLVTPADIQTEVDNHYAVVARGGQIILSAKALNQLQASVIKNDGELDASNLQSVGGHIILSGDNITLGNDSSLTANGATGGGSIEIGGTWRQETGYQASRVTVDQGARINADATQQGKGGLVVIRSNVSDPNGLTQVDGFITTQGAAGGVGGRIETSGYQLGLTGTINAGAGGEWLLDPVDITVTNSGGAVPATGGTWSTTGTVSNTSINTALNNGNNLTLDATGSGAGTGSITISAPISKTAGGNVLLTLNAGTGGIAINNAISASVGQLALTFNSQGAITSSTSGTLNTNGGLLTLNPSANGAMSGVISGSGALSYIGSAVQILNGANSYGGGTTISSGTLVDYFSATHTSGAFGSGNITLAGGNLQINTDASGSNTYDTVHNITVTANSGLASDNGDVELSSPISLAANATLTLGDVGDPAQLFYLLGVISGPGSLIAAVGSLSYDGVTPTLDPGNQVTLKGANTFSGTLTVATGALQLTNNNSNNGLITINPNASLVLQDLSHHANISSANIVNNGKLSINNTTITYAGSMSGNGILNVVSNATFILTGNNPVSSGFFVTVHHFATLQIGNGGAGANLSAGTIDIVSDSHLIYDVSNSLTYNGILSDAGSIVQAGTGTVTFSGDLSTFTGNLTVANGTLQLADGGNGYNVPLVDIVDNANLVFNYNSAQTYSNNITGSGNMTQQGSQPLTLTGDNSYGGTTTVASGSTLLIGNGTPNISIGTGPVVDNGSLIFNLSANYSESSIISGSGGLTQAGSAPLLLLANNSYSGDTTINTGSVLQIGNGGASGSVASANIID